MASEVSNPTIVLSVPASFTASPMATEVPSFVPKKPTYPFSSPRETAFFTFATSSCMYTVSASTKSVPSKAERKPISLAMQEAVSVVTPITPMVPLVMPFAPRASFMLSAAVAPAASLSVARAETQSKLAALSTYTILHPASEAACKLAFTPSGLFAAIKMASAPSDTAWSIHALCRASSWESGPIHLYVMFPNSETALWHPWSMDCQ